jgi:hypothetical protein
MDPRVLQKLDEIKKKAARGGPSGLRTKPTSPHHRVTDNNLSRVIRNKEESDSFFEQLEAIFAYNAMKRRNGN